MSSRRRSLTRTTLRPSMSTICLSCRSAASSSSLGRWPNRSMSMRCADRRGAGPAERRDVAPGQEDAPPSGRDDEARDGRIAALDGHDQVGDLADRFAVTVEHRPPERLAQIQHVPPRDGPSAAGGEAYRSVTPPRGEAAGAEPRPRGTGWTDIRFATPGAPQLLGPSSTGEDPSGCVFRRRPGSMATGGARWHGNVGRSVRPRVGSASRPGRALDQPTGGHRRRTIVGVTARSPCAILGTCWIGWIRHWHRLPRVVPGRESARDRRAPRRGASRSSGWSSRVPWRCWRCRPWRTPGWRRSRGSTCSMRHS